MTNLASVLKSRDITLSTKVHLVKAMVFPEVMYGCESWIIKKAESRRIDAFELWYWRRLLRVPCTTRRSNQSILKEISPEYSLEGLMLKLKLQSFGHLMRRPDSFEKTNLDSIFKSRDITLPTKICIVKAMVFSVVMYGCESWTIKRSSAEELMPSNCSVGEDS